MVDVEYHGDTAIIRLSKQPDRWGVAVMPKSEMAAVGIAILRQAGAEVTLVEEEGRSYFVAEGQPMECAEPWENLYEGDLNIVVREAAR